MLAFLKQTMESRHKSLQLEGKPPESNESMDISKEFLEIIQLSYEAKVPSETSESAEEKSEMIKRLQGRMDILFHDIKIRMDAKFDDIAVLAVAYYNLGLVYVNSKEDYKLRTALTFFKTCLQLLRDKELDRKAILTSIGAFNEMNSVFVKLEKDNYIYSYLKSALELYLNYTKEDDYSNPIHVATVIGIKEKESNPKIILENLYFTTLRDMAIQYFEQPEDKHEFITHMYILLKKQLSQMISEGRQFREDCINLVLTLFDMSRYFLIHNRFIEARNHLATADYVMYKFSEETLKTINQQNDVQRLRFIYLSDSYDYGCGVSARSWGTYGISLLRFWKERLLQNKDKKYEVDNLKLKVVPWEKSINLLIFSDVKNEAECMTNQITHTRILNLTDAKSVFIKILKHFDVAKAYFTAETDIETYAKIILEVSTAYKYLASFEHNRDIQLKLHKRRVQYLENVCKKFHTIIDKDSEFQTYKRVWFEMVISCSTVMDLTLEETYHNEFRKISKEVEQFAKLILGNISLYLHSV